MSYDEVLTEGIKIFSGNSNRPLAQKIAEALGLELSDLEATKYSDGECSVKINESVRGYDIFVIQSTSEPVNDNLMELLIIIDGLKRASAGRITAVMPFFAYARQDKTYHHRDPISARLVADLLVTAGADRVLTLDIHTTQIQGFFSCPMENMRGNPIFADYYSKKMKEYDGDFVVVTPNIGSVKRNRTLAESINLPIAIIDKRFKDIDSEGTTHIIGDIKDKNIIMVDDMINTGKSMCDAADDLKKNGAKRIFACCSHPIFSDAAVDKIKASAIEELVILDTINQEQYREDDQFKILSVKDVLANAIISIHNNESISRLYNNLIEL